MFKGILSAISLVFISSLNAQSISGTVEDSKTGMAMERVVVVVIEQKKAAPVATTFTNEKGQFKFENLSFKGEEFTLTTRMVGYAEFQEIYSVKKLPLKVNIKL